MVHDFLRIDKRPESPRALAERIAASIPDPTKRREVFRAAVYDDRKFLARVIDDAFDHYQRKD